MTMTAAPSFIIHAAGSLGNRPDAGRRAYRLRFAVIGDPQLTVEGLRRGLSGAIDEVERQMRQQGFVFAGENTIQYESKRPYVEPMTIRPLRRPTAREMLPQVAQGARFRAPEETLAVPMPTFEASDAWEYIFSAIFVHDTIRIDIPKPHEERH